GAHDVAHAGRHTLYRLLLLFAHRRKLVVQQAGGRGWRAQTRSVLGELLALARVIPLHPPARRVRRWRSPARRSGCGWRAARAAAVLQARVRGRAARRRAAGLRLDAAGERVERVVRGETVCAGRVLRLLARPAPACRLPPLAPPLAAALPALAAARRRACCSSGCACVTAPTAPTRASPAWRDGGGRD
ncbi:MAG: hypothetical protein ACK41V_23775, partial [Acidovorax sp.]|uniref:hypothetical protein n=1 Tax=Acidovorax sp. TaxID=1872122 RepID=UPI00391CD6C7